MESLQNRLQPLPDNIGIFVSVAENELEQNSRCHVTRLGNRQQGSAITRRQDLGLDVLRQTLEHLVGIKDTQMYLLISIELGP